jgi:hypothetical protein
MAGRTTTKRPARKVLSPQHREYLRRLKEMERYLVQIDALILKIDRIDPYGDTCENFAGLSSPKRLLRTVRGDLKRFAKKPPAWLEARR